MSFTQAKRDKICKYLLEQINDQKKNIVSSTALKCSISPTSVRRYLKFLEKNNEIQKSDTASGHELVLTHRNAVAFYPRADKLEEDVIYASIIEPVVKDLPQNVEKLWCYAFNEIMNNAIDHAEAETIGVLVTKNSLFTRVMIDDDGIGIFNKIQAYISSKEGVSVTIDDAVIALFAGKLTTNSQEHSGEGIFFSSRVMDNFIIVSSNRFFTHDKYEREFHQNMSLMEENEIRNAFLDQKGTTVLMELSNNSKRELEEVFDMFSTVDRGFYKTQMPVKNAITSGFAVSRSQARRLCSSFDKFEVVELDFRDVDEISQAFAHEIFVVYQNRHPNIEFEVKNANDSILDMIKRVKNTK